MGKRNRNSKAAKKQANDATASPSGPLKKFSPNRERPEKNIDVQIKSPASRKITEFLSPSKAAEHPPKEGTQTSTTEYCHPIEAIPAGLLTPEKTPTKDNLTKAQAQPEKKKNKKKPLVKELFVPSTNAAQGTDTTLKSVEDCAPSNCQFMGATKSPEKKKPSKPSKKKEEKPQTTTLTNYFPIRRSNRKSKRQLAIEKKQRIEEAILEKKEEGIEVKDIVGKGRGVVATRHFSKGDFIVEYAGNLIDRKEAKLKEAEYLQDTSIGCYMYYFIYKNKQYCVDATAESGRLGRLINHSKHGNCCTKLTSIDDTPYLILCASKDIEIDQELLYDYGDRDKESLEAHPWLAL
ncbi:N-lysine methyltransferase KMT5A-like [Antedon mediterranea]|uniref:N-lysine methyltransferase KMT5A-like n=1 Tax=Antedon mediterranea TaxID=105859 RepID=UPI003AF9B4D1